MDRLTKLAYLARMMEMTTAAKKWPNLTKLPEGPK